MSNTDRTPTHPTAAAWQAAATRGPVAQAGVVATALAADPAYADTTVERLATILAGFAARQQALGRTSLADLQPDDVAAFVHARTRRGDLPSPATSHLRRTAVRTCIAVMRRLGAEVADPTTGLVLPARTRTAYRPLDPEELALLRITAETRTRRRHAALAAVALSEAGATTGEVARLRWADITDDRTHVALPGVGRTLPRTVALTPWGIRALPIAATPDPDRLVVYNGRADPESDTAQAAVTTRLRKLLHVAGLDDPDLRPGSIRLCLPAAELAAGTTTLQACARRLGLASLDVAADLLQHHWQDA